jgi:hypothetical protein
VSVPPPDLATVPALLAHVAGLPSARRDAARTRIEAALELPAMRARAALGMLALDLAAPESDPDAHVLVLPELSSSLSAWDR